MQKLMLLSLASLALSACGLINLPVTPLTLAGCWEGSSSLQTTTARLQIRGDDKPDFFLIDGKFTGLINSDFKDYPVKFEDDELKPQGAAQLIPARIRVEDGRLILTSLVPPTSFTLSRCK